MSGADVGHPGAGIQNQPSVASMVWSFDQHAMKYVAFSSVQEPRRESIEDLKPMMMVFQNRLCYSPVLIWLLACFGRFRSNAGTTRQNSCVP